jgi:N6-adenosine-specific RNA methylase IME4
MNSLSNVALDPPGRASSEPAPKSRHPRRGLAYMSDPFADLPRGHFGAILADPPWRFKTWSGKGLGRSADRHYSTMAEVDVRFLPVDQVAAEDSVLFLWVPWSFLSHALRLIENWGFTYKTSAFDWHKEGGIGMGYWTRLQTEPCLLATRGKPKRLNANVRQSIIEPRREHSRKPDCVHERIERLVAGPYLELWARKSTRPGWTFWGNEIEKFNEKNAERI